MGVAFLETRNTFLSYFWALLNPGVRATQLGESGPARTPTSFRSSAEWAV
jgi:hypothetical protein